MKTNPKARSSRRQRPVRNLLLLPAGNCAKLSVRAGVLGGLVLLENPRELIKKYQNLCTENVTKFLNHLHSALSSRRWTHCGAARTVVACPPINVWKRKGQVESCFFKGNCSLTQILFFLKHCVLYYFYRNCQTTLEWFMRQKSSSSYNNLNALKTFLNLFYI